MVPLWGSVNPTTPPSPYADLMAQRIPFQTKYTFPSKFEVHLHTGKHNFLPIYKWSPTVFCESNDTTLPLCRLAGPEKTSPDETHIFDQT